MTTSASPPLRVGQGWDSHRTEPGRPLILGGVQIPCEFGLAGHSDADVLFHAVTDAILGALALGDIGMHFPDTAAEWRGAESRQFLKHALGLAAARGYEPVNVDSTIILERPLGLAADSVGVKFKTAERVGPVGEGRSCEAQAIILLAFNSA